MERLSPRGPGLYELHLGTFTAEGTWEAAAGCLPRLVELGVTAVETHAGRRVPGHVRLGLRRGRPVRALPSLRNPGRFPALRRPRPCARPGRDPRRGLQPLRTRRATTSAFSDRLLHRAATRTTGATPSTSMGRIAVRSASIFAVNAGYWIREFHLDGLRLDATHAIHRRLRRNTSSRTSAGRPAPRPATGTSSSSRRTSRRRPPGPTAERGRLRARRRCGTTTSTTARASPLPGVPRPITATSCGTPQELISAVKWGFLVPGTGLQVAAETQRVEHVRRTGRALRHLPRKP